MLTVSAIPTVLVPLPSNAHNRVSPTNEPLYSCDNTSLETPPLKRSKRGIARTSHTWPTGSTVTLSLGTLTAPQQEQVKRAIDKIAPHINLDLKCVSGEAADIRIGTIPGSGAQGWSAIGTGAKSFAQDEITMGLTFADPPEKMVSVIAHEILHALGVMHEHQHPDRTLTFNKKAVTQLFQGTPDPAESADYNILNFWDRRDTQLLFTPYDKRSIMHYSFTSEQLNGAKAVTQSDHLSKGDINLLRQLYPFDQRPPLQHTLKKLDTTAVTQKLWPAQTVVTVSLNNMGDDAKKLVKHNINKLAPYLPVHVKFVDHDADIRIFPEPTPRSWSRIGTDAKNVSASDPTMGIYLDGPKKDTARAIKQMFARAMGLGNVKIPKDSV